jgi:hypothetical protein
MIFSAYSDHAFKFSSGLFVALLMYFTIGESLIFDGVLAVSSIVIALAFRDNKDIVGICLVIVVIQVLINVAFVFSNDTLACRIVVYAITLGTLAILHSDSQARLIILFLIIALASEFYWAATGYDGPEIYFAFLKLSVFVVAKFFVLYRSQATKIYLKDDSTPIRLDWLIHKTLSVSVLLELAQLLEYLIRHNTSLKPLVIYYAYPYAAQCIGVFILWLIINQANQIIKSKSLSA